MIGCIRYGRDGGKEGLYEYVKPAWQPRVRVPAAELECDLAKFGASYAADGPGINGGNGEAGAGGDQGDRTYKLYYGGAQKRPDANYSRVIR